MKQKSWFPILYMFIITASFSSVLIGFASFTKERVEANKQFKFESAVVAVLPFDISEKTSSQKIHQIFIEQVAPPSDRTGNAYSLIKDQKTIAYALPFSGQGYWAPVKGVIGIAADKKTITGFAVYEQNETPGLGAEIAKSDFQNQFNNKIITNTKKPLELVPISTALESNQVHAVTGATQTSVRLEKLINDDIKNWLDTIEKGGLN